MGAVEDNLEHGRLHFENITFRRLTLFLHYCRRRLVAVVPAHVLHRISAKYAVALLLTLFALRLFHTTATPLHQIFIIGYQVVEGRINAPVQRHPCAPCGCQEPATLTPHCIDDERIKSLSAKDVAVSNEASVNAARLIKDAQIVAMQTKECVDRMVELQQQLLSVAQSFPVAAGMEQRNPLGRQHALWHWYFRPDLAVDMSRSVLDGLVSWLTTQEHGSNTVIFWFPVGSTPPTAFAAYARLFPGVITWRFLDMHDEAKGTPLEGTYQLHLHDSLAYVDGDFVRLLLLYKYGGYWSDTDMYYRRDMAPLSSTEYAMEFGCWDHTDWKADWNGALMRFRARDANIGALLDKALRVWPKLEGHRYGPHLLRDTHVEGRSTYLHMPHCFLHGMWCEGSITRDTLLFDHPWRGTLAERSLRSAYALHVHGGAIPGRADRVHNSSMIVDMGRSAHATLEVLLEAKHGAGSDLLAWYRSMRHLLMLCPPGSEDAQGWCYELMPDMKPPLCKEFAAVQSGRSRGPRCAHF